MHRQSILTAGAISIDLEARTSSIDGRPVGMAASAKAHPERAAPAFGNRLKIIVLNFC